MKKLIFTTAVALVLATGAYAQQRHGPSGGPGGGGGMAGGGGGMAGGGGGMGGHGASMGGGMGSHGPGMGGGAGPGFSAQRGPSGPNMGNRGPTGNVYNRATNTNAYGNNGANRSRFTERNHGELYNRAEGEGGRVENGNDNRAVGNLGNFRHGIVSGNFFEHGRHFGFRRFWNGEWVFLTALDSCTAWAWVNVGPGAWAWSPIDICVG